MARFKLSRPAQEDLERILATSLERWGEDGRARYAALLATAMRVIAAAPQAPMTRDRAALMSGVRSFHVRHVRGAHGVKDPVHILYYRAIDPTTIEIVRVLHDRMEPSMNVGAAIRPSSRSRRK